MLSARDIGSGWTKISFERNVEQYGGQFNAILGLVPQLG